MRRFHLIFVCMLFVPVLFTPVANADDIVLGNGVTLITDAEGQLKSARSVRVGDGYFDVEFLDGSCPDFYTECTEEPPTPIPPFTTLEAAEEASQALLDQVFLDVGDDPNTQFDTVPSLTFGCFTPAQNEWCAAATLFGTFPENVDVIRGRAAANVAEDDFTRSWGPANIETADTRNGLNYVFAKWSPGVAPQTAPVPTLSWYGMIMALLGILGLAAHRVRRIQSR